MLKRLIMFLLFQGSLDSFSQVTNVDRRILFLHDIDKECGCSECIARSRTDTTREQLLVTMTPMGIAHSRYGLAVIRNDTCIAHLDCRGRPLKPPIRVWDCEHNQLKRRAKQ